MYKWTFESIDKRSETFVTSQPCWITIGEHRLCVLPEKRHVSDVMNHRIRTDRTQSQSENTCPCEPLFQNAQFLTIETKTQFWSFQSEMGRHKA